VATHDQLLAQGASPEEAAAVVAALERHLADTAPRATESARRPDRWTAAARLEAADPATPPPSPWGERHPWID
jgi:hypothetical protein